MRPPGVKGAWDTCDVWAQSQLIAYSQLREYEESEEHLNLLRASGAKIQ